MSTATKDKSDQKQLNELENLIAVAIKKVGAKKENDLCRYIPGTTGGYMHHFTFRKLKTQATTDLVKQINKYIIQSDRPANVPPKQRAARGSRKRRDHIVFSRGELDHMLKVARQAGDKELIRKLTPKKDFKTIKRELISCIKRGEVDHQLWDCYCEVVENPRDELHNTSSVLSRF